MKDVQQVHIPKMVVTCAISSFLRLCVIGVRLEKHMMGVVLCAYARLILTLPPIVRTARLNFWRQLRHFL